MSDPRPATPRLPARDRRQQLLDIALDFFSRKGFEGTTTKEIAAAAGVTEAIIFRQASVHLTQVGPISCGWSDSFAQGDAAYRDNLSQVHTQFPPFPE